jgi:hypothetical protein
VVWKRLWDGSHELGFGEPQELSSIKDFVAHVLKMTARKQTISGYL